MNLQALQYAEFRRYFAGNIFALHGMWLQRVTLGWLAWSLTGQAGFVGFVAFLSFAPTLISGPFFGVVADRVDLRRAGLVTQMGLILGNASLLAAHAADALTPVLLAAIAGLVGFVTSAHHPIRMTIAPRLVERSALASVIALTSINFNMARLVGPALGGWIIARWGVGTALLVNLALFLPLIFVLLNLRPNLKPAATGEGHAGFLASLRAGVAHASGQPLIRRALLLTGLFSLIGRGVLEILPAIADGAFQRGPAGFGTLTAAAGAGALVASTSLALGTGQIPGRFPRRSLIAAVAGLGLVIVLGRTEVWPLAIATVAALGLCSTLVGVSLQSAVQLSLAEAYRGRVMSLWTMVAVGAAALGAIVLGTIADHLGIAWTLTLAGLAGLVASLPLLAPLPLARHRPPDDVPPRDREPPTTPPNGRQDE